MSPIPNSEAAFEELFKAHYPAMVLYAHKFVGDTDTARDIAQQVFVNIYEKRKELQIRSSMKSYLFQSVRNTALNRLKQQRVWEKHEEHLSKESTAVELVSQTVEFSELRQSLIRLIEELPPRCRDIFKMNRFEGKKNREIAEELNISIRTVETQISKALKFIREKLPKELIGIFVIFF